MDTISLIFAGVCSGFALVFLLMIFIGGFMAAIYLISQLFDEQEES
jgi:phage shock protein PspC (stress-responsive transcriptional regulator)